MGALLISSEKTTVDRSCRRLPRNNRRACSQASSRTYTGTNTDERFKKTFRVSEATFIFILGGIQYDLQRDTVIVIIIILIIIITVVIIIDKNHTFQCSLINNKNKVI